jgi:hypothetical protein
MAVLPLNRRRIRSEVVQSLEGLPNATAIWHARERVTRDLVAKFPGVLADTILNTIMSSFRCYAGFLHLRFGANPEKPDKRANPGYASTFEQPVLFSGRMEAASNWSDLRGRDRDDAPWLNGLPRLIFVSDMGDALSEEIEFS